MSKQRKLRPVEQPSPVQHVHAIRTIPCKGNGVSVIEVRAGSAEDVARAASAVWDCLAASKAYLMIDKRPGSM